MYLLVKNPIKINYNSTHLSTYCRSAIKAPLCITVQVFTLCICHLDIFIFAHHRRATEYEMCREIKSFQENVHMDNNTLTNLARFKTT